MASGSLFLTSPEREGEHWIPPRLYGSPTCVPSPQQAPQAAAFAATIKEVGMFARHVTMRLKPNTVAEFTTTLENEVIPLLQKQKGFRDEIVLVVPGGTEAVGISFWDQKENADAYSRETYPEVNKSLRPRGRAKSAPVKFILVHKETTQLQAGFYQPLGSSPTLRLNLN